MPCNATKAGEHGFANGVAPQQGASAKPASRLPGGSTLSEENGSVLLEDFVLREKLTHFDHERIPERIVHARGSAAHGFFECYAPFTQHTKAAPFKEAGESVFCKFHWSPKAQTQSLVWDEAVKISGADPTLFG